MIIDGDQHDRLLGDDPGGGFVTRCLLGEQQKANRELKVQLDEITRLFVASKVEDE